MTDKTVAQKARVKPGTSIAVLNRVPGIVESLGLPEDVTFVDPADAELVFLFVNTRAELEAQMPSAVASGAYAAGCAQPVRLGERQCRWNGRRPQGLTERSGTAETVGTGADQ